MPTVCLWLCQGWGRVVSMGAVMEQLREGARVGATETSKSTDNRADSEKCRGENQAG